MMRVLDTFWDMWEELSAFSQNSPGLGPGRVRQGCHRRVEATQGMTRFVLCSFCGPYCLHILRLEDESAVLRGEY